MKEFLDWVQNNKDISDDDVYYISNYVKYNENKVTGIFGYLLEYFDSIGYEILVDKWHCIDNATDYWMATINGDIILDYGSNRKETQENIICVAFEFFLDKNQQ